MQSHEDAEPSKSESSLAKGLANLISDLCLKQLHVQAGYPQEALNEIHGSWFDPANPVAT